MFIDLAVIVLAFCWFCCSSFSIITILFQKSPLIAIAWAILGGSMGIMSTIISKK